MYILHEDNKTKELFPKIDVLTRQQDEGWKMLKHNFQAQRLKELTKFQDTIQVIPPTWCI